MKEFKGTKGPWVWSHNGASSDKVYCIEIKNVNSVFSVASIQSFEEVEEINKKSTLANANLIAAAPELLEVLRQLRDFVEDCYHRDHKSWGADHPMHTSKVIIAKALGESK